MPEFYMTLFCPKNIFPEILGRAHAYLRACRQLRRLYRCPCIIHFAELVHQYYGFLPFRRSLSPKSPRVSVGVRVRIRVRVRARVIVRNRSIGSRRFEIRRNAKEPSYLVRMC